MSTLTAQITFYDCPQEGSVPYHLYIPPGFRKDLRPLVTVHGISRNALEHAQAYVPFAARSGRMVIAPLFSKADWPRYQRVVSRDYKADEALFMVLEDVSKRSGAVIDKIDLFGFSGGSQFAHRFAMFHPERIERLALAAAGWYTFPTEDIRFPYGFSQESKSGQRIAAGIDHFLNIPTLVFIGTRDTKRDASLRKTEIVDENQGSSRVERAIRWVQAMRQEARKRGLPAQVKLEKLEDCGHNFGACVAKADLAERVGEWFGMMETAHTNEL